MKYVLQCVFILYHSTDTMWWLNAGILNQRGGQTFLNWSPGYQLSSLASVGSTMSSSTQPMSISTRWHRTLPWSPLKALWTGTAALERTLRQWRLWGEGASVDRREACFFRPAVWVYRHWTPVLDEFLILSKGRTMMNMKGDPWVEQRTIWEPLHSYLGILFWRPWWGQYQEVQPFLKQCVIVHYLYITVSKHVMQVSEVCHLTRQCSFCWEVPYWLPY